MSYGLWSDHVLGWWQHKDEKNILFLKYEDLKKVCIKQCHCKITDSFKILQGQSTCAIWSEFQLPVIKGSSESVKSYHCIIIRHNCVTMSRSL